MLDVMVAVLVIGVLIVLAGVFAFIVGLLFGNDIKDAVDEMVKPALVGGVVLILASGALGLVTLVL